MATNITTTQLVTDFGNYYIDEGQGVSDIKKFRDFQWKSKSLFTRMVTKSEKIRFMESTITDILQPFQKSWTPIGDIDITPHEFDLFRVKAQLEPCPDELVGTYAGFLAGLPEVDRSKWPFVKWLMEVHVKPKLEQNIEFASYQGVYAAPTTGTAGSMLTSLNGINQVIQDHIADGDITPIPSGVWSTDPVTFVEELEAWVKQIDIRYRGMEMTIALSQDLYDRFRCGMEEKYNVNYARTGQLTNINLFANIKVDWFPGMAGSNRVWCTANGNAIMATKGVDMLNKWGMQLSGVNPLLVQLWTDQFIAFGFALPKIVWTNDQN